MATKKTPFKKVPSGKKVAMVAPPPKPPPEAAPSVDLATVLQQWGNDRAYTVIRQHGNSVDEPSVSFSWEVLFEGDLQPCLVKVEHNKVVMIKD